MNQVVTRAIILSRTDYGEADRILTLLTPDQGKVRLLAKGVRRVRSKLAGGIELFSVSTVTYIRGRGELGTLISSRLERHYGAIVTDLERTMLGYELIKQLHKATEDETESEYFELLDHSFKALNDLSVLLPIIRLWFWAQLVRLSGHMPNLQTDVHGKKLDATASYAFDVRQMAFVPASGTGGYNANHIKFLRLVFAPQYGPKLLMGVRDAGTFTSAWLPFVQAMVGEYGI